MGLIFPTGTPAAGDTFTHSGANYIYRTGPDRWDPTGITGYDLFAGFEGPYLPNITDPTQITWGGPGNGFNNSPWGGSGSGDTNIFSAVDATTGYWAVQDFGSSSADFTPNDAQNVYLAMPYTAGSNSPMAGSTYNTSANMAASDFTEWKAYVTDGTYSTDAANDITTDTASLQRFNSTRRVFGGTTAVDMAFIQMGITSNAGPFKATGSNTISQNAADCDVIEFTVSSNNKSTAFGAFAGLSNGDVVTFRRGELIDGFWANASNAVGTTEYAGSGSAYRVSIYELYTRIA